MPETRRAKSLPMHDLAVDPDFDQVDRATDDAVDWVVRGHSFECLGGVEVVLPKEGK